MAVFNFMGVLISLCCFMQFISFLEKAFLTNRRVINTFTFEFYLKESYYF